MINDLEAKPKAAQEEIMMLRCKKVVIPPRSPITGRDQKASPKRARRQNDGYKRRKTKRDNQKD